MIKESVPAKRSIWQHKNGNMYRIIEIANLNSNRFDEYPITIVYQRLTDGTVWSRTLDRWYGSFSLRVPAIDN